MTLARLTTWVDGNTLTAAALNGEFDNIVNNPITLISPLTGPIDFNLKPPTNLVLEAFPGSPSSFAEGHITYYSANQYQVMFVGTSSQTPRTDSIVGPSYGLGRVTGLQGSLISNIGSFAAQGYQLQRKDPGSLALPTHHLSATSSFSVNTQTVGPVANGRDQAAVFTSTTVHFYAISTGHRSTSVAGVVSTTPPPVGPVMPSSYVAWTYLCSIPYNTATSVVRTPGVIISGSRMFLSTPADIVGLSGTTVETSVSLANLVPQQATAIHLQVFAMGGASTGANGTQEALHNIRVVSGTDHVTGYTANANSSAITRLGSMYVAIPNLNTPPGFYYLNTLVQGTSASMAINLVGYTVPNGDSA